MKVLVLGGYGNFGARICRALAGNAHIDLVVAGRDAAKAQAFAARLPNSSGIALDLSKSTLADALRAQHIGVVIHTAGPFQDQGYAVARACAAAGAHYIDLADGRRFVCDFPAALQQDFVAAQRTAICGASTVPALSSAVVNALCAGWQRIDSIDICIAPAQTAPRGVATLEAVLSYCGTDIALWRDGRWQSEPGWARPTPVAFARLRSRRGAVCDIPDLELFPAHYQVTQRVEFRAALEVALSQYAFAALAWLHRLGLLRRPAALAGLLDRFAPFFDGLGTALGGMVVRVAGQDAQGTAARRSWHIAADHDYGPEIPCMAAILLARRLAAGEALPIGAMVCVGLHQLDDFAPEFAKWGMQTDWVEGE